ncbi:MAG: hypothetical protein K2X55_12115 [Burkholderiaceae bacterium]|nr:hypothetical protein [Burkholderiaceae bacterium]
MHRDSLHDTIRSLDCLSDAQIAALTFPKEGLRISTSLVIQERYVGATKLPPGPPNGLEMRKDGSFEITRVAIVRVQPDEYRLLAAKMLKKATRQSVAIGVGIGLIVATAAFVAMLWWQKSVNSLGQMTSAPCLVASIENAAISCRIGEQTVQVAIGKYFPDGRYLLDAVDPVRHGFTATRTTDRRTVVFQADQKLVTPQPGALQK